MAALYWGKNSMSQSSAKRDNLEFLPPALALEQEALALMDEFYAVGETFVHGSCRLDSIRPYREWLKVYGRAHQGKEPGFMPCNTYIVRNQERLVGVLDVRLRLTDAARRFGNIGYSVAPACRGRGYGSTILAFGLDIAAKLGENPVLVCCHEENLVSRRVIEKNGMKLASSYIEEETQKRVLMYTI